MRIMYRSMWSFSRTGVTRLLVYGMMSYWASPFLYKSCLRKLTLICVYLWAVYHNHHMLTELFWHFHRKQSCRPDCDQHVSDTPIYKFDLLILNIITQYFAKIFCSPIEVTLQKVVIAHLVWTALIRSSQRHFTYLCVGCNLVCMNVF